MTTLQQQILTLFAEYDPDVREVIASVLQIEQENIHLKEPRYKKPVLDVLDRVARETLKGMRSEH